MEKEKNQKEIKTKKRKKKISEAKWSIINRNSFHLTVINQ